ncbi:MAG TPA: undecaprenyl-diphosphate phosphatase [Bacillota bacterium]|nr:undecaprenyl-diphosphate phosphatase [Bacillota bacterium]
MSGWVVAGLAGCVQGVVEWLPVSSKTMITLLFAAGGYRFETAYVMGLLANFGSFFAALWYFRRDIAAAVAGLRRPFGKSEGARLLRYLVLATAATGAVGVPIYALVNGAFSSAGGAVAMGAIGVLLLLTSGVNLWRERLAKGRAGPGMGADPAAAAGRIPGPAMALLVGACQGFAALPGISRSAITVTPLLLAGNPVAQALRLSFVLDVIGLLGAGLVPLVVGSGGLQAVGTVGWGPVALMVGISAVVSFVTIAGVLRLASRLRSSVLTGAIGLLTLAAAVLVPR